MANNTGYQTRTNRKRKQRKSKVRGWFGALLGAIVLGAVIWLLNDQRIIQLPGATPPANSAVAPPASTEAPIDAEPSASLPDMQESAREIDDFRMLSLDAGWFRYADGTIMVTEDGGVHWREAGPDWREPANTDMGTSDETTALDDAGQAADEAGLPGIEPIEVIEAAHINFDLENPVFFGGQQVAVKRVQAVAGQIGWALAAEGSGLAMPLLVTVDGGRTWHDEVTAQVRAAMEEEKTRQAQRAEEAALYASTQMAQQAMKPGSVWTLLPDKTYPGDVVLVRRGEPGQLEWQGQTYELQPYKAGYFTYLPIPRSLEPGTYTIGDAQLTVKEKTFKTQQLKVSQQMESLRENTERIAADRKKISDARAQSAPTFLFDSAFIEPLQGRLTTPYGYLRYVNGKLSSAHMAIDVAAPMGTPLKATNDGVVVLADDLLLTGYTIYLDHGMGLFSEYAHLSELHVEVGDTVKKGDIIGLVGSTGFSTGPHLHFTFWAHNVPVNPNLFFNTTPFHWQEEALEEPSQPPA